MGGGKSGSGGAAMGSGNPQSAGQLSIQCILIKYYLHPKSVALVGIPKKVCNSVPPGSGGSLILKSPTYIWVQKSFCALAFSLKFRFL